MEWMDDQLFQSGSRGPVLGWEFFPTKGLRPYFPFSTTGWLKVCHYILRICLAGYGHWFP